MSNQERPDIIPIKTRLVHHFYIAVIIIRIHYPVAYNIHQSIYDIKREYVIGILAFNVVNALMYVVSDGIMNPDDNYGDIEMMDKAGLDRDYVGTFLVAHSLFALYRIYYKTNIPAYLEMSKNEIKLGVTIYKW